MELLTSWLALHLDTLSRHGDTRLDPSVEDAVRSLLNARLQSAQEVSSHFRDGALRGIVVVMRQSSSFLGVGETECWIDLAADDVEAQSWALEQLRALAPRFDETFVIPLDVSYEALLGPLATIGLGVHKLVLHGSPPEALAQLCETQPAWPDLEALGLRIEPLRTAEQIEQIVASRAAYFAANPAHGGLHVERAVDDALQETIDRHVRDKLTATIAEASHFVILRDSVVMGSFGFDLQPAHPALGRCAGIEIAFDPAIHGHGLAPLAYRHTLERMVEVGIDVFKGQTSNPAVIHMARRMRRPLRAWMIRPGTDKYPAGHFDYRIR